MFAFSVLFIDYFVLFVIKWDAFDDSMKKSTKSVKIQEESRFFEQKENSSFLFL